MSEIPECLQPAVEQLEKFEVQIAALEEKNSRLDEDLSALKEDKQSLETKIQEQDEAAQKAAEAFETEKLTLRELNVVVSEQLREKIEELNALSGAHAELEAENGQVKSLNSELTQQKTELDSHRLRTSINEEAQALQSQQASEELEALREQVKALKDENSALTLVNSAMHQRQQQALEEQGSAGGDNSALLAQIEQLTKELDVYRNDTSDEGFLRSENERLMQRHGEITQEKMQMSAKMHTALKELDVSNAKLEDATKNIEQLEFDLQGLQNLHKNLTQERDSLLEDNATLVNKNSELQEKVQELGESIQRVTTEKEMVMQELSEEHIKADAMTEEVNHLRMKSRTLAEDIKNIKQGQMQESEESFEPQVQALEIQMPQESEAEDTAQQAEDLDIDIVTTTPNSGPHFPGESTQEDDRV